MDKEGKKPKKPGGQITSVKPDPGVRATLEKGLKRRKKED